MDSEITDATLSPNLAEMNTIRFSNSQSGEVLRIDPEGRIFWKGREVETDDQLRSAMLDVRDCLMSWRV